MHNSCSIFLIFNFPNQCFQWIVQIQRNIYAYATEVEELLNGVFYWLIERKKMLCATIAFSWKFYGILGYIIPWNIAQYLWSLKCLMKFPQFYSAIRNLAIFCSLIFISHCSFVSLMIFFSVYYLLIFIDFSEWFSVPFHPNPHQIRKREENNNNKEFFTIFTLFYYQSGDIF